jgi:hypothetical protein
MLESILATGWYNLFLIYAVPRLEDLPNECVGLRKIRKLMDSRMFVQTTPRLKDVWSVMDIPKRSHGEA